MTKNSYFLNWQYHETASITIFENCGNKLGVYGAVFATIPDVFRNLDILVTIGSFEGLTKNMTKLGISYKRSTRHFFYLKKNLKFFLPSNRNRFHLKKNEKKNEQTTPHTAGMSSQAKKGVQYFFPKQYH